MAELKEELGELMLSWQKRQMTTSDAARLWKIITEQQNQQTLSEILRQYYDDIPPAAFFTPEQKIRFHEYCTKHAVLQHPDTAPQPEAAAGKDKNLPIRWKWLAAATVLLAIGLTYYVRHFVKSQPSLQRTDTARLPDVAPPKSDHAVLTLGTGSEAISLNKGLPGIIAQKQGVKIRRGSDGCIIYEENSASAASATSVQLNTLTVPKGSKPVQIQLPDGTHVWVNAASSLKFPASFKDNTRNVYLSGEAYFEVFHNAAQPFVIYQGINTVKVLGTHFNVDGYKDDLATRVTLLQGSVSINNALTITPGQQAVLKNGHLELNSHPDLQEVMAWKNNKFIFNGAGADQILRQLSRWYNVEIVYSGKIPEGHYSGLIDKDNNLSTVLRILESGGLRFKIDQNKLIVL